MMVSFAACLRFPAPLDRPWNSVACRIPKGRKRGFEIRVREELIPCSGPAAENLQNEDVLRAFEQWRNDVSKDLCKFRPNGLFALWLVNLGFLMCDIYLAPDEQLPVLHIEGNGL